MSILYRERYEVPLVQLQGSLLLEVMCHGDKVLLINITYLDTTQAVYYPEADLEMPRSDAELACRLALGHFRSRAFHLYTQDRRNFLRRCVLTFNRDGPLHQGVLLKLQEGAQPETEQLGASLTAS